MAIFTFIALSVVDVPKTKKAERKTTKDQQLQQQTNDLKLLQTKPQSQFLSAYVDEKDYESEKEKLKERPRSEIFLSKDIEAKLKSGHAGTMRDRKNRLEVLDLQPVAVDVPKVPGDSARNGERRAPEGEEGKGREDSSSPLKRFASRSDTRYSELDCGKGESSVEYFSDSDGMPSDVTCPPVIRRHPRKIGNRRDANGFAGAGSPRDNEVFGGDTVAYNGSHRKSFDNPMYDMKRGSFIEMPLSKSNRSASRRSLRDEGVSSQDVDQQLSSFRTPKLSRRNIQGTESDGKGPPDNSTNLLDEIVAKRRSLRRSRSKTSIEEDDEITHVNHPVDIKALESKIKRGSKENICKDSANGSRRRPMSHGSMESFLSHSCDSDDDDNVFFSQSKALGDRSPAKIKNGQHREHYSYDNYHKNAVGQRSGRASKDRGNVRGSNESISDARLERKPYYRTGKLLDKKSFNESDAQLGGNNRKSDGRPHRRRNDWPDTAEATYYTQEEESDFDGKWDIDVDSFTEEPVRTSKMKSKNDGNDVEYNELVKNLTRGRAIYVYDDERDREDQRETKRSKSHRGLCLGIHVIELIASVCSVWLQIIPPALQFHHEILLALS